MARGPNPSRGTRRSRCFALGSSRRPLDLPPGRAAGAAVAGTAIAEGDDLLDCGARGGGRARGRRGGRGHAPARCRACGRRNGAVRMDTPRRSPRTLVPTLMQAHGRRPGGLPRRLRGLPSARTQSRLSACYSGDLSSSKTLVLFGGFSMRLNGSPLFSSIALAHHWRLLSLIKSSCPSVGRIGVHLRAQPHLSGVRHVAERHAGENRGHPALRRSLLSNSRDYSGPGLPAGQFQSRWECGPHSHAERHCPVAPARS